MHRVKLIDVICSDIIDNFEVNGLRVAIWSLVAALHHYFRYAEEYTGEDERERLLLNEQIQNNRQDAFWNLERFARNVEMHCSSKVLTTQLHTLLCRLPDQEKNIRMRGGNGRDVYRTGGMQSYK